MFTAVVTRYEYHLPRCHPELNEGSRCLPEATIHLVQAETQIPRFGRGDMACGGLRYI